MNIRKRIVTLLAVSVIATMLAPLGAQARPSKASTNPFGQPQAYENCWTKGSGLCTVEAAADGTGRMTGAATSSVKEDPLTGVTGTALGYARSGYHLSFSIPRAGASSVTFTVDTRVNSASAARSNPLQNAYARVYFTSSAYVWRGNCTSCTVRDEHTIADSLEFNEAPAKVEGQDESFTFVLQSGAGDRLKGRVDVYIRLAELTWVGVTEAPVPMEGTAEARGDAVLKKVSAVFNA